MHRPVQQRAEDRTIRLLLIDDPAMVRVGIKLLLESQPDMKMICDAGNGDAAVALTLQLKPDVLLLDMAIPRGIAMDVLRRLAETHTDTRTIVLTASIETDGIVEAIQLGARGVVLKESAAEHLFKAIRMVMAGEYWVDRSK